ncbi:MAG: hypothetical protein LBD06_05985 [Candidatus Accumulibacter sp.]|nr:hypothetical protein [Accumulibacter sp.]
MAFQTQAAPARARDETSLFPPMAHVVKFNFRFHAMSAWKDEHFTRREIHMKRVSPTVFAALFAAAFTTSAYAADIKLYVSEKITHSRIKSKDSSASALCRRQYQKTAVREGGRQMNSRRSAPDQGCKTERSGFPSYSGVKRRKLPVPPIAHRLQIPARFRRCPCKRGEGLPSASGGPRGEIELPLPCNVCVFMLFTQCLHGKMNISPEGKFT